MPHTDARLRALLQVLVNSPRPEAVARTLRLGTLHALNIRCITIHAVVGEALELRSHDGLAPAQLRLTRTIPLALPALEAEVARTAQPRFLLGDALEAVPHVIAHHDTDSDGDFLALPLMHEARPIGVLTLHSQKGIPDNWDSHDLLAGVCSSLTLWLLSDTHTAAAPTGPSLLRVTDRQQRVLERLRRGLTNGAIAAELGFAVGTIKADITAMSSLFGAVGREDLLRKASRAGF